MMHPLCLALPSKNMLKVHFGIHKTGLLPKNTPFIIKMYGLPL